MSERQAAAKDGSALLVFLAIYTAAPRVSP